MAQAAKTFDPKKSVRATYLNNLTDKQLFERYLKPAGKTTWLQDMDEELNTFKPNSTTEFLYPLCVSLEGKNLDYIISAINLKIPSEFIPNGYKLNSKQILTDVEAVLNENRNLTRQASLSENTTLFIADVSAYFVNLIKGRCLEYSEKIGLTV